VNDVPKLEISQGRHAAEWFSGGRAIAGELELEPGRPPVMVLFDDITAVDWADGEVHGLPEHHRIGRLLGRLRSNHDVVVTDADISTWFPRRNSGHGRYAVVGLGVADVPHDRYDRIRLQITGADLLFGIPPLKAIRWPTASSEHLEGEFVAVGNPDSTQRWEDDSGMSVECHYSLQFSLTDPYRHQLIFAPIVDFRCSQAMTVDEWVSKWVMPLQHVASLATRGPQRLAWLTVHTTLRDQQSASHSRETAGVVFGGGIHQAPFEAEYREEWRDPQHRPLFTLPDVPNGLLALLRRWLALESDRNPFVELYGLALSQHDLPARARFLYLLQALEALHGHENKVQDDRAQERFGYRRKEILAKLRGLSLDPANYRFLRDNWGKRRPDSLDRRLAALIQALPVSVAAGLFRPDMARLAAELSHERALTLPAQLRSLRNHLSHGGRNYDEGELAPWVRTAETICRAHVLRLLEFDNARIERGLAESAG
jgi:hypothetical protein